MSDELDTQPSTGDEGDAQDVSTEGTEASAPAEVVLLAGGITTPDGYTHIHTVRLTDQEDDSVIIDVENVLPNAAKDHSDHTISLAFERAPVDGSYGRLRVRKIQDHAATIHVFRKDEDGTTTFTVRTAHGS